jgi:hypothetical protein
VRAQIEAQMQRIAALEADLHVGRVVFRGCHEYVSRGPERLVLLLIRHQQHGQLAERNLEVHR